MKIEIEISEVDAACIWADNWGHRAGLTPAQAIKILVESEAQKFRSEFPGPADQHVADMLKSMKGRKSA